MKKVLFLILIITSLSSLAAYEVYRGNIYPGAVNHRNSSYSYGLFSLNTMESDSGEIVINRILAFNKSRSTYEYSYDSEGRLIRYSESLQLDGEEVRNLGTYIYEYNGSELRTVELDGEKIYFPSPYFVSIRQSGDELLFDLVKTDDGAIETITLNDENGTKYFFREGRLQAEESIGRSDDEFSARYEYNDDGTLRYYRKETIEGRGLSRKKDTLAFTYKEGLIDDFFFEKSGQGQGFERIHCTFEHITNDNGTVDMSFALNDEGETLLSATYEYESASKYKISVFDARNRLLETIEVEKR